MSLLTEITALRTKEGTLTGNKVCNFAYDDTAYADDTSAGADGVSVYNYNNHNNIPVKDNAVIKVNPTITAKGFRSQLSTLPRMLLNHIFGRVSYNLNKTVDVVYALLDNLYSYIGVANGLATLDIDGRLPYSQLPLSAVEYKGAWNADTNTPTLASGTGTYGDEYIVSVAGTQNLGEGSITYSVGDRVIYNGSIWQRIPAGSVRTVNNKDPDTTGDVELTARDVDTPDVFIYDRSTMGRVWSGTSDQSHYWYASCFANGLWVAGSSEGLWWSEDGKSWTQGTGDNTTYTFNTVYYFGGLWVAGSSAHGLWWSTDGKSWTAGAGDNTTYSFDDVTCNNGLWVACSNGHGLWWSTDGKAWTQGTGASADSTTSFIKAIYANGIWVAVRNKAILVGDFELVWSLDGKNWSQGSSGVTEATHFYDVFVNGGLWVACSGGKGLYWSTDGKNWTQGTGGTSYDFNTVFYSEGLWIAGSVDHGLWSSTDGKNWTQVTGDTSSYEIEKVYTDGFIWLAGTNSHGIWWSTDGSSWAQGTSSASFFDTRTIRSINSNDEIIVMFNTSNIGQFYSEATGNNNVADILDYLIEKVDAM